ncbi:ABC transporter ATP-binding protein [Nocardioides sp. zg-1228]|uniref:ABC transporter ATP-binding protein n=1 Tax=Nocardioides sp. zg-1228 TaxID=2763008 RepID=UPI001642E7D8|nr:ABC transporter ATP-binding protein [Nocardioides sp. zg-1228]MBC2931586.1 ABC transporter ATP-binding protein [Nocardioides sp. zg-1228]QSF57184.1 ABC transporter ATP-binding protein [Nocardioides sp. zg-1228]
MTRLQARGLTLGYGDRLVVDALDLAVPHHAFTAVVGPNACGKSTLLRALVRLLPARSGTVELDGRAVKDWRSKDLAREVGFLPQATVAPEGIRVEALVRRGRYAHQSVLGAWRPADDEAVSRAMDAAGVATLADRPVAELSGGQRQRVWVAMVLAQETPYLLLDEPTTFLDIAHQYDLLRLLRRLVDEGRTVVVVLHDLNQACRFADHVVAMRDGRIVASGAPSEVVTADLVHDVFDMDCVVVPDPVTATPMVVPAR